MSEAVMTKQEALAYLGALRLLFAGKTGFKAFTEDFDRLIDYVERTAEPNSSADAQKGV